MKNNEGHFTNVIIQPVRSIDDFECLVETIIEDSDFSDEDIVKSLENIASIYRNKMSTK